MDAVPAESENSDRVIWGMIGALFVVGFSGYFAGTYFTQDDYVWLCFAKFFESPGSLFYRDSLAGQFFRPVGQYWWLAVHSLFGAKIVAYQVAYLGLHLLNTWMAYRLAARLAGTGVARVAGMVFAMSPIYCMPISNYFLYVYDVIGCTFYLLTLLLLSQLRGRPRFMLAMLSLAAAPLAYFSKESCFTLPAAIMLVMGIEEPATGWRFSVVRRHWRWIAAHALLALAAWAWRRSIIGGFGGYGLAEISSGRELGRHVLERLATLIGFSGWSTLPFFSRWERSWSLESVFPVVGSVLLLGWLTWITRRSRTAPGALWCWAWILVVWSPSALMTTYAPVSFYPALLGMGLMVGQAVSRVAAGSAVALLLGALYAAYGWMVFRDRGPDMKELRDQHLALPRAFPVELWTGEAPLRLAMLEAHPDLFPDAALKYFAPRGSSMSKLILFNLKTPVNWVVTDDEDPGDLLPLEISSEYQNGFMAMKPYRVYPLQMGMVETPPANAARISGLWGWKKGKFELRKSSETEPPPITSPRGTADSQP